MNLNLKYEGFEDYLVFRRLRLGGVQYAFRFENGYGASVVKHDGSYGNYKDLWELAVVKFIGESDRFYLVYTTDITCDVVGYLTDKDVQDLLRRIKEL